MNFGRSLRLSKELLLKPKQLGPGTEEQPERAHELT